MVACNWYYLSEMAISNSHGGGLTVQRVLGDDLNRFAGFIHVSGFATGKHRMIDGFESREVNLHELCQLRQLRAVLPFARWRVWPSTDSVGYYAERLLMRMERFGVILTREERWARLCARYLTKNFELENSAWLIVPQSVAAVRVANGVFRRKRIRYITWIMDDHVVRWDGGWQYPPEFERAFGFHLQHARRVFVISPAMARFYKQRFGVNAEVLFGPTEPVGQPVIESIDPRGPVRLGYFGAVWPWQRDGLERLVERLEAVGAFLDIFTFDETARSLAGPRVAIHPPLGASEVIHRMREYDGVVIAISFRSEHRHLAELNISTKMSECLASGTVTVIAGPEYAAMVEFAREGGGAVVISDFEDCRQLAALECLKDRRFRERVVAQARRAVEGACSVSRMRQVWERSMGSVATEKTRP